MKKKDNTFISGYNKSIRANGRTDKVSETQEKFIGRTRFGAREYKQGNVVGD